MHLVGRLRAQDLEHLAHHEIAPGVGVAPGQRHGLPVGLAQIGLQRDHRGRLVHMLAGGAIIEAAPGRQVQEAAGGAVAEAAAAKVNADPDPALLVLEQIDKVVAAAHRAQLAARQLLEPTDIPQVAPGRVIE